MVVFTCQHCGDPVKKPGVEKHYNTRCRYRSPHLTCVDCLKDFSDDYGGHNQCMTEAQRYSAHGTVFKEQKGMKKQEQFTEMIQTILSSEDLTLSGVHRPLLEVCSNYDNVPRKLKKFENFLSNTARHIRYNSNDIKFVFTIIENAWKKQTKSLQGKAKEHEGKETTDPGELTNINGVTKITDEKNHNDVPDQSDLIPKKAKKKNQSDKSLSMNDVDEENRAPLNEDEDMNNEKLNRTKKDKHKKKSLQCDIKNLELPEENGECPAMVDVPRCEEAIDSKSASIDDVKENLNKLTKKQLKKQKKYEKYLAELEKEEKPEIAENTINAEVEESTEMRRNKKKIKKLKTNRSESEYLRQTEDENVNDLHVLTKMNGKSKKKRKLEEFIGEPPEKKIKEISEEGKEGTAVEVFNWGDVITSVLQSRPDKEISLKKLGKKVVNEYQAVKQDHKTYEELLAKFNKKVCKIKGVRVLRDRAKLIE